MTWTFQIGQRVKVINHFEPESPTCFFGIIVGQDQMGDQYFSVKHEAPNRFGEYITTCEDKVDMEAV